MRDAGEIQALTEREISESGCLAPCAFLARLGRLDPRDLQSGTAKGRLLDHIYGDLAVVAEELRLALEYARKLGLREEPHPISIPVGTCAEIPDDRWAMIAWRRAPDAQMDLFFDNPGRTAAAQLKEALIAADTASALEHLDALESVEPSHPLAAAAPRLIDALEWRFGEGDPWDCVHTATSLAHIALGERATDFANQLWRRLADMLPTGTDQHLAALEQAGAWNTVLEVIAGIPEPTPAILARAIHAARAVADNESATRWLVLLCLHPSSDDADVEPVLGHPAWEAVADDWYEKGLDELPWSLFPAFLAMRGVVRECPEGANDTSLIAAIAFAREPTQPAHREAFRKIAPELFSVIHTR